MVSVGPRSASSSRMADSRAWLALAGGAPRQVSEQYLMMSQSRACCGVQWMGRRQVLQSLSLCGVMRSGFGLRSGIRKWFASRMPTLATIKLSRRWGTRSCWGDVAGRRLDPAAVDDVALVGDGAAVVGGQEEGEAGDFFGLQFSFEGLAGEHLGYVGFVEPESLLALGKDAPGKDGIDADVVRAELVGEGAGEADDGSFGGDVDGQVGGGDEPGDGAHIDDGAALTLAHAGDDGLGEEELVFEVDGEERVPEFGGDVAGVVAGVVGGVVDEDVYGRECGEESLEGGGVGEVAVIVRGGVGVEAGDEGLGGFVLDVEEEDAGALLGEGFHEGCSDAGGSAGDEDGAVAETGVGGVEARHRLR